MELMPNEGAMDAASALRTHYANGKIRLFRPGVQITPGTTEADLIAGECNYDGYAPITIAAFNGVILAPGAGAAFISPSVQFPFVAGAGVTNVVAGYWFESAGGKVARIQAFPSPISMAHNGDAIPIVIGFAYGLPSAAQ